MPVEGTSSFSSAHFLYIPLMLAAGVIIGWILGARGSATEIERLQAKLKSHERKAAAGRLAQVKKE